jgi:hypothetical protein
MPSGPTFWALIKAPEPLPAIVDAAEELGPQTVLLPDGRQVVVIMLDEFVPRRASVLEVLEASAGLGELPDLRGGDTSDDSSR